MHKRDALIIIIILGTIYGGLYAYSGNRSPLYVVASGSMIHDDASYGRIGTIDPGDLIIARKVSDGEVETWTNQTRQSYGDWGDVLIYYPNGERWRTPVIHRAITWVNAGETVCVFGGRYTAPSPGYLTKGDHNLYIDQPWLTAPVDPSWIIGVSRGEMPWIGLIGMGLRGVLSEIGIVNADVDIDSVPTDCWVMLAVVIALIGIVAAVGTVRDKG